MNQIGNPNQIEEFWKNLQNQTKPDSNQKNPFEELWSNLLKPTASSNPKDVRKLFENFASGKYTWNDLLDVNSPARKKLDKIVKASTEQNIRNSIIASLIFAPFAPRV